MNTLTKDLQLTTVPPLPNSLSCYDRQRNCPRWLLTRYDGMEQDIVDWYQSYYFHDVWDGRQETIQSVKQLASLTAEAKMEALVQSGALMSAFEEATVLQLHEAQRDGWYRDLGDGISEIRGLQELIEIPLAKEIEKHPRGGPRYEYQELLKQLSALEEIMLRQSTNRSEAKGRVRKAIVETIANPQKRSKLRESSRVITRIMESSADEETKLNLAAQVFEDIASQKVSYDDFRQRNRKRIGIAGEPVIDPVPGTLYIFGGVEWIVIESRSQGFTRAVESAMKGLVTDLDVRDPVQFLERLSHLLMSKSKFENLVLDSGTRLVHAENGFRMPTPELFRQLAISQVADKRSLLEQLLIAGQLATLAVYEFPANLLTDQIIPEAFQLRDNSPGERMRLQQALQDHYPIPVEVQQMMPYQLSVGIIRWNNAPSLGLIIRPE